MPYNRQKAAKRIAYCIRLLFEMNGEHGVSTRDFAARCGVSRRTVFRWLNALEEAGVPYFYDVDDRVHRTRPGWAIRDLC